MQTKMKSKAQSMLEYAVLVGIIALALAGMSLYFRRGIQAAIKVAADEIGNQSEAEETDPNKGTKTASLIQTLVSGSQGTANLPQGATQRIRGYLGGGQRTDFDTTTTSSGNATYNSTREQ